MRQLSYAFVLGVSSMAIATSTAEAKNLRYDIESQPLSNALKTFALVGHDQVFMNPEQLAGKTSSAVRGVMESEDAIRQILHGTGFHYRRANSAYIILTRPIHQTGSGGLAGVA